MKTYKAKENDVNRIIFKFLIKVMSDVPVSKIEKLFRKKDVKVNGKRIKDKSYKIKLGDIIVVYDVASNPVNTFQKTNVLFNVVYEDNNILIVSKPINIVMHGEANSLDNQVLTYLKYEVKSSFKPSHVGRLDRVSSGICIYAKTYEALVVMNENTAYFEKIYMLKSDLRDDLTVEYRIIHDEEIQRMRVADKGDLTKTKFFRDNNKQYAQIFTGKKHQIRVSLSKLGKPIYGDVKYGGKRAERVYLHCYQITLNHLSGKLEYLNGEKFINLPKKW